MRGLGALGVLGTGGYIPPLWGYTSIWAVCIQPTGGSTPHNKWGYTCFTSTEPRSSRCAENNTET